MANGSAVVRIGILGAARIAARALIAPAWEVGTATVAAVATRGEERAKGFALQHGIPAAYGSYEALLADPSIDAVYIPLPNALHGSWTLRAIAAGKHVLCEKPFAANADEAQRIAGAADASGLVVMEAMHYRYHPLVQRMAAMVAGGAIGTPRYLQCWTSWAIPEISDIRYSFPLGGGALMDGGCYAADCLRLLGPGEPEVTGALADPVPGRPVDRSMAVRLSWPSGLSGWFESSFTGSGDFRADVYVSGDEGHLLAHLAHPARPAPSSPAHSSPASFSVRSFCPAYQVATSVTATRRTVASGSPTSEVIAPAAPMFSATARDHCCTLSVRAPGTRLPNRASHTSA